MPKPISHLIQAIENISDQIQVSTRSARAARRIGQIMLDEMRKQAPSGERWIEQPIQIIRGGNVVRTINHGRPSERIYGTTIEKGWLEPEVTQISRGSRVVVPSRAPHAAIVAKGSSRGYDIPSRGVAFMTWYRDGMDAPSFTVKITNHPGQRANDYPGRSYDRRRDQIKEVFREEMFDPLREVFQ